ncbi:MAG TPA: plastocyanin/azurin family copper-binding protein [Allosphingosinicella sp.]
MSHSFPRFTRRPALLACAALLLAAPGAAQPDWSQARRIDVTLSNFEYRPSDLTLRAGEPVMLHLMNIADGGHDFTARKLFESAMIRERDKALIRNGGVEVPAHESRDIGFTPVAGRYKVECTHPFHHMMGMAGEILVQ